MNKMCEMKNAHYYYIKNREENQYYVNKLSI